MKRVFGYCLVASLAFSPVGYAQEEGDDTGGLLVRFLEDTLSSDSRTINVIGLEGTFSSRATIEKLTVSDDDGIWLTVEGAVLDWNRLSLLRGRFSVNALGAEKVEVLRAPNPVEAPEPEELPSPEATPFALPELPVAIEIGEISIPSVVLGEELAGESALLSLDGKFQLADGAMDTDLKVARLDRQGDGLSLQADFSNETRQIDLDLDLREGPGGVFARLLKMPNTPAVEIAAKGSGQVEDFTANLKLATNGEDRLSGRVSLQNQPDVDRPGIGITADLGGDVRPLLPEEYQSFFGDDLGLRLTGLSGTDGSFHIDMVSLQAAAVDLTGRVALSAGGILETASLDATVSPADGDSAVLLPLAGPATRLARVDLNFRKMDEDRDAFELTAVLNGLDREDLDLDRALVTASGAIDQSEGLLLDALVNATVSGLKLADTELAMAIGEELSLSTRVLTDGSGALKLRDLNAAGADYAAQGDFAVKGLSTGMEFETLLTLDANDVSRFSGFFGQDLGGRVAAEVAANGTPLAGVYDVDVTVVGEDLLTGIAQIDGLLTGRSTLHLKGARDYDGLRLDDLDLKTTGLVARGNGELNSNTGALIFKAKLNDLGRVIPGESGSVLVTADVTQDGRIVNGMADLVADDGSKVSLLGKVDLDGPVDVGFDAFVAELNRFIPGFNGDLKADGKATRQDGVWSFDTEVGAPLGVRASVKGRLDENTGAVDAVAQGNLRLDIADPFIQPQTVDGTANFDVTLSGTLENLLAEVEAKLSDFAYSEDAISSAIGSDLQLRTTLETDGQDHLDVKLVDLEGDVYALRGSASVTGLSDDLRVTSDLRLGVSDLARFSGLAGRELAGNLSAALTGSGVMASQEFDVKLDLLARDVKTGIAQLDDMIVGSTTLQIDADRSDKTLTIDRFALTAAGFDATANGQTTDQKGQFRLDAKVNDIGPLVPGTSGPLTLAGDVIRDNRDFTGTLRLDGPSNSFAMLDGTVDMDGGVALDFDALVTNLNRFAPELAGEMAAKGNATREGGMWNFATNVEASAAGIVADASGSFDEASGNTDIVTSGSVKLDVANVFIEPNSVKGTGQFDLTLKGKPGIDALSGTISTSGTSLAIPAASQTLENIAAQIKIADSSARLQVSAGSRAGGGVRVSGPISLAAPFESAVDVAIENFVFTDNLSLTSTLVGELAHRGALLGDSRLSGRINFVDTEINLANLSGSVSAAPIPPMRHVGESGASLRTRDHAGLIAEDVNSSSSSKIALDILLSATKVFARGRGLQAELGGNIEIGGTTAQVEPAGQIELVRGTFNFLGRQLELNKGIVSLQGDLNPYLEFESTTSTSDGSASLLITGPLDSPEITATSDPERPSEEALALVLFGDNIQDLSPLALAQLTASVAQLRGGGAGLSETVREGAGTDTASLSTRDGSPGLGLGGYAAENLYTDFSINTRGETELRLNLDVTDNVTVKGTVDQEGETSLGLFFQRDY